MYADFKAQSECCQQVCESDTDLALRCLSSNSLCALGVRVLAILENVLFQISGELQLEAHPACAYGSAVLNG